MNTRRMLTTATAALALALALPAAASLEDEPGYVDLGFIEIPDHADEIQDIDLTTMLETIADDARAEGEVELAEVLAMVRSVRVKFFSVEEEDADVREDVERVLKILDDEDWTRIVYIKDGDETVSVSTKNQDGKIVGLTVVVYDPTDTAGFVNVVGDIDLGKLLAMSGEFDFDDLEEYAEKYGHRHPDDERVHVE